MFKVKANLESEDGDKKCTTCEVLEDEKHVFEDCPKFASIRQKYSPDEIAFVNVHSDDPKQLLKVADFAEKIETAILLDG